MASGGHGSGRRAAPFVPSAGDEGKRQFHQFVTTKLPEAHAYRDIVEFDGKGREYLNGNFCSDKPPNLDMCGKKFISQKEVELPTDKDITIVDGFFWVASDNSVKGGRFGSGPDRSDRYGRGPFPAGMKVYVPYGHLNQCGDKGFIRPDEQITLPGFGICQRVDFISSNESRSLLRRYTVIYYPISRLMPFSSAERTEAPVVNSKLRSRGQSTFGWYNVMKLNIQKSLVFVKNPEHPDEFVKILLLTARFLAELGVFGREVDKNLQFVGPPNDVEFWFVEDLMVENDNSNPYQDALHAGRPPPPSPRPELTSSSESSGDSSSAVVVTVSTGDSSADEVPENSATNSAAACSNRTSDSEQQSTAPEPTSSPPAASPPATKKKGNTNIKNLSPAITAILKTHQARKSVCTVSMARSILTLEKRNHDLTQQLASLVGAAAVLDGKQLDQLESISKRLSTMGGAANVARLENCLGSLQNQGPGFCEVLDMMKRHLHQYSTHDASFGALIIQMKQALNVDLDVRSNPEANLLHSELKHVARAWPSVNSRFVEPSTLDCSVVSASAGPNLNLGAECEIESVTNNQASEGYIANYSPANFELRLDATSRSPDASPPGVHSASTRPEFADVARRALFQSGSMIQPALGAQMPTLESQTSHAPSAAQSAPANGPSTAPLSSAALTTVAIDSPTPPLLSAAQTVANGSPTPPLLSAAQTVANGPSTPPLHSAAQSAPANGPSTPPLHSAAQSVPANGPSTPPLHSAAQSAAANGSPTPPLLSATQTVANGSPTPPLRSAAQSAPANEPPSAPFRPSVEPPLTRQFEPSSSSTRHSVRFAVPAGRPHPGHVHRTHSLPQANHHSVFTRLAPLPQVNHHSVFSRWAPKKILRNLGKLAKKSQRARMTSEDNLLDDEDDVFQDARPKSAQKHKSPAVKNLFRGLTTSKDEEKRMTSVSDLLDSFDPSRRPVGVLVVGNKENQHPGAGVGSNVGLSGSGASSGPFKVPSASKISRGKQLNAGDVGRPDPVLQAAPKLGVTPLKSVEHDFANGNNFPATSTPALITRHGIDPNTGAMAMGPVHTQWKDIAGTYLKHPAFSPTKNPAFAKFKQAYELALERPIPKESIDFRGICKIFHTNPIDPNVTGAHKLSIMLNTAIREEFARMDADNTESLAAGGLEPDENALSEDNSSASGSSGKRRRYSVIIGTPPAKQARKRSPVKGFPAKRYSLNQPKALNAAAARRQGKDPRLLDPFPGRLGDTQTWLKHKTYFRNLFPVSLIHKELERQIRRRPGATVTDWASHIISKLFKDVRRLRILPTVFSSLFLVKHMLYALRGELHNSHDPKIQQSVVESYPWFVGAYEVVMEEIEHVGGRTPDPAELDQIYFNIAHYCLRSSTQWLCREEGFCMRKKTVVVEDDCVARRYREEPSEQGEEQSVLLNDSIALGAGDGTSWIGYGNKDDSYY